MQNFFRIVRDDFKQRKNIGLHIPLFLSVLVAISVTIASIFGIKLFSTILGIDQGDALSAMILAALSVLIYQIIEDKHSNEKIQNKQDLILSAFPQELPESIQKQELRKIFRKARRNLAIELDIEPKFLKLDSYELVGETHYKLTVTALNKSIADEDVNTISYNLLDSSFEVFVDDNGDIIEYNKAESPEHNMQPQFEIRPQFRAQRLKVIDTDEIHYFWSLKSYFLAVLLGALSSISIIGPRN